MLFVYFILTVLSTISLGKSELNCEDKDVASDKFEYYTLWYRFKHGLLFWTTRKICALSEEEGKYICAQVAHACFPALNKVPVEDIEKEIKTPPGPCKKEEYTTPKKEAEGDFKGGWKKMFLCPKYTAFGQLVTSFFVSYGGSAGSALIFDRESTKNLNINEEPPNVRGASSFIKLANYVTGLHVVRPQNNQNQNNQHKSTQNVNIQSKSDPNKDTRNTEKPEHSVTTK